MINDKVYFSLNLAVSELYPVTMTSIKITIQNVIDNDSFILNQRNTICYDLDDKELTVEFSSNASQLLFGSQVFEL